MSHKYISNPSNLFEDDDVDDDTFVNSYRSRMPPPQPKPSSTPLSTPYGGHIAELERQKQQLLLRQREIEQRTLDSSSRSIGLLRESENIGIATAEELVRQREQLEVTNKRLDEINTNLNYSQKHLNGIKSVFYGLKNYISGKSNDTPSRSQTSPDNRSTQSGSSGSRLQETIGSYNNGLTSEDRFETHPSARLRGLDQQSMAEPIPDSQRINKMLDDNLDEMVQHINRLKGLGTELGREIETQNELIDTIHDKVEGADLRINKQNKQMNKLLGK